VTDAADNRPLPLVSWDKFAAEALAEYERGETR
jgi:hypothetical protein